MLEFRSGKQKSSAVQILKDLRISADDSCRHLFRGRLAAHARKRSLRFHDAFFIDHLYERNIVDASDTGVILTERRRAVYDTGTVLHGYIVIRSDKECSLFLLLGNFCGALVERLVFLAFQFFTCIFFKDLIRGDPFFLIAQAAQDRIQKRLSHVIGITVACLDLAVGIVRVHAKERVRRKSPGRRGPCQEIRVLALSLKADDRGTLLQSLVTLSNLLRGKRCAAARAVGNDLEALVQKLFVPDLLQGPPFRLNVVIIIGNIRIIHISPETDRVGEILPHALVFPDIFLTFINKRNQTILFDLLFAVQSQLLLYFQLYRKSVSVPAGFSRDHFPLHGMVTRDHILDHARQHMADVGLPVCCGRAVIERVCLSAFSLLHALLEDLMILPELFRCFLTVYEIEIRRYFGVQHMMSSSLRRSGRVSRPPAG